MDDDPTASKSNACRLEMQEQLKPLINNWFDEKVPLLMMNVFQIGNKHHLLFSTFHLPDQSKQDWHQATWYCHYGGSNGSTTMTIMTTITKTIQKSYHGQLTT
jgi:hypothetical protein